MNIEIQRKIKDVYDREIEHAEALLDNMVDVTDKIIVMEHVGRLKCERAVVLNAIMDAMGPLYEVPK